MEDKNNKLDLSNLIFLSGESVDKDLKTIEQFYIDNKINNNELNICISNEKDFTDKRLEILIKTLKILSEYKKDISVIIVSNTEKRNVQTNTPYIYSNEEMNKLIEFNNSLNQLGIKDIVFSENYYETWSLNTVIDANNKLDSIVEQIKKADLSPYETMLAIHKIVSNIAYCDSKLKSAESPRCLPGIFKNGDIVCVGYSHLVKTIIDKLNNKGLKAEIIVYSLYEKKMGYFAGGHANNRIIINDEKYNIKGSYFEDSCWDSKNDKFSKSRGFAHCMFVEKDMQNLNCYFADPINGLSMKELDIGYAFFPSRYGEDSYENRIILPEPKIQSFMGEQIDLETFKKAYKNMLLKLSPDKINNINNKVNKVVELSSKRALDTFSKKVENIFYKEGVAKNYTPLKKLIEKSENMEGESIILDNH